MLCILKYGGNIPAAIRAFALSSTRYSYLLKNFGIEENLIIEYQSPPPPIAVQKLSKQSTETLEQKLFKQSSQIKHLEQELFKQSSQTKQLAAQLVKIESSIKSVNSSYKNPSSSIKLTEVASHDQTDGTYKQKYSQAHYSSYYECFGYGYFNNTGIPIGYHYDPQNRFKNMIYYQGELHLITIAPTGSGKLTAVQIPVLME